jgi:hypothetical protein
MWAILFASNSGATTKPSNMERVMGIEPTSSAWKAEVLPLNYTRLIHQFNQPNHDTLYRHDSKLVRPAPHQTAGGHQ